MSRACAVVEACREHHRQFRRFVTPRCQLPQKLWDTQIQPPPLADFVTARAGLSYAEALASIEAAADQGLICLSDDRSLVTWVAAEDRQKRP